MKKSVIIIVLSIAVVLAAIGAYGRSAVKYLKAEGYIRYSVDEAVALAHKKCAQCHSIDKTAKYCMRCGPPFVVVVHNMRTYIAQEQGKKVGIEEIRDGEAVAITQVWNALVGNWEETWRKEDLKKLLGNDIVLLKLLDTPVKEREIEATLKGKSAAGSEMMIMKPEK